MNKWTTAAVVCLLAGGLAISAVAQTPLERGRYLMQAVAACGNCHTPQDRNGAKPGMELAGGLPFDEPGFKAYASNITPDADTGIGRWTDAQIVTAIREGKRPDGSLIGPPMPFGQYRGISDRDAAAIVAYLRSVPPVKNAVPKSDYSKIKLPPAWGPPVGPVAEVTRSDPVVYGRYIAGPLAHCMECHSSPGPDGTPDAIGKAGGGGMRFPGPWGESVAANITPSGLAHYSDAQLKKIITTGVRPDGTRLKPPMGVQYYAHMSAADQTALMAYLHSLPRK